MKEEDSVMLMMTLMVRALKLKVTKPMTTVLIDFVEKSYWVNTCRDIAVAAAVVVDDLGAGFLCLFLVIRHRC